MKTDVLIVGAGLAGCTLGLLLRQSGIDVLAAELKDASHKQKLCAGAMHPDSIKVFDDIYGPGSVKSLSPLRVPRLVQHCLDVKVTSNATFFAMPREQLDDYCLSRYMDEGGRLVDRVRLVGVDPTRHLATFLDLRDGGTLEVSYKTLVGADGASSAVRRILTGRKQRVCPAVQGIVPFKDNAFIFEWRLEYLGYCWYIPHKEDATIGCMLHGETGRGCRERLDKFCASLGFETPSLRGAAIPEGDDMLLQAGEDAWLVGDAAGIIDAFDGSGIQYALESSRALASALTGGEPYEKAMADTLSLLEHSNSSLSMAYFLRCLQLARRATGLQRNT